MADLTYPITDFPNDAFESYAFLVDYNALKLTPVLEAMRIDEGAPNEVVLTFDVAPSAGDETLIDALVADHAGTPYPFTAWQSMYALDWMAQADQSLSSDTLTVDGVVFRARNVSQAGTFTLTNGVGLVIDTTSGAGGSTIEFFGSATAGPRLEVNLDDLYAEEPDDEIRLCIEAEVTFTNASQFSFCGIVGTIVDTSGSALGTATTYHGQSLRGNDSANNEEVRARTNDNSSGGERVAIESGVTTLAVCSLMLEWLRDGCLQAYVGDARSGGYWPSTWNLFATGRPSNNANNGQPATVQPLPTTLRRRAAFYAGRAGSTSEQGRIEVRFFEAFVRRTATP